MNKTEVSVRRLLVSKWMIPAYIFLGISILILVLEILGLIEEAGVIGVVIAMNLFTVSLQVPILIQIYVKLSEISVKIG
jgi:hypothetical protein